MAYEPNLKKKYREEIIPALKKEYNYKSVMQVPRLSKIIVNQGVGQAVADKKLSDTAQGNGLFKPCRRRIFLTSNYVVKCRLE